VLKLFIVGCGIGYGCDYRVAVAETEEEAKQFIKDAIHAEYEKRRANLKQVGRLKREFEMEQEEMEEVDNSEIGSALNATTVFCLLPTTKGYVPELFHRFME